MLLSDLINKLLDLQLANGNVRVVFVRDDDPDHHSDPEATIFCDAASATCGENCAIVYHE